MGFIHPSFHLRGRSERSGAFSRWPPSSPLAVRSERVGTRPRQGHMQIKCPNLCAIAVTQARIFNDLRAPNWNVMLAHDQIGTGLRGFSGIGAGDVFTLTIPASYSLFGVKACCIMERAAEGA